MKAEKDVLEVAVGGIVHEGPDINIRETTKGVLAALSNYLGPDHVMFMRNTWTVKEDAPVLQSIEIEWRHKDAGDAHKQTVWQR